MVTIPDHSFIFVVRTNPDPNEVPAILNGKRPVIEANRADQNLPTFLKYKDGCEEFVLSSSKFFFDIF